MVTVARRSSRITDRDSDAPLAFVGDGPLDVSDLEPDCPPAPLMPDLVLLFEDEDEFDALEFDAGTIVVVQLSANRLVLDRVPLLVSWMRASVDAA